MYDHSNEELIRLPNLNGTRYHHGCGLVTKEDGTREVVIAGGYQPKKIVDLVEILNLDTNTWR